MVDTKTTPRGLYTFSVDRITKMVNQLEDGNLRLMTHGMGINDLRVDMNSGWQEVEGFRFEYKPETDLVKKFVDDFNEATRPIRERFANELRQLLANECLELGSRAIEKGAVK